MTSISYHSMKCFRNIVIYSIALVIVSTNVGSEDNPGPFEPLQMEPYEPSQPNERIPQIQKRLPVSSNDYLKKFPGYEDKFAWQSQSRYIEPQGIDSLPDPGMPKMPNIDVRLKLEPKRNRLDPNNPVVRSPTFSSKMMDTFEMPAPRQPDPPFPKLFDQPVSIQTDKQDIFNVSDLEQPSPINVAKSKELDHLPSDFSLRTSQQMVRPQTQLTNQFSRISDKNKSPEQMKADSWPTLKSKTFSGSKPNYGLEKPQLSQTQQQYLTPSDQIDPNSRSFKSTDDSSNWMNGEGPLDRQPSASKSVETNKDLYNSNFQNPKSYEKNENTQDFIGLESKNWQSQSVTQAPISINTTLNSMHETQSLSNQWNSISPDNQGSILKKRCRKFELNSIKNIELIFLSGDWNQLYTSFVAPKKCTQISFKPLNEKEVEFKEFEDCDNTYTGVLSKTPSTSKLVPALNTAKPYSFWPIKTGIPDLLLVYQCYKESDANSQVSEHYRVLSRKEQLSETVLQNITHILSEITNGVSLSPIPRTDCLCDRFSSYSVRTAAPPIVETLPTVPGSNPTIDSYLTSSIQDSKLVNPISPFSPFTPLPPNQSSRILENKDSAPSSPSTISTQSQPSQSQLDTIGQNNQVQLLKKRCRKFESNSIKNIDLNSLSGHWNELYESYATNKICTQLSLKASNEKELDFNEFNDCENTFSGVLSKAPFTSKLILTDNNNNNKNYSFWSLDIGFSHILLIYQCFRPENDPNSQFFENYRVFSRQRQLPETVFQNIKNQLLEITTGVTLQPISHINCFCDRLSRPESKLLGSLEPNKVSLPQSISNPIQQTIVSNTPISTKEPNNKSLVSSLNQSQPKSQVPNCRTFELNSIKNIDFDQITGVWDQLYTTHLASKKCTQIELKPLNDQEMGFTKFNDCDLEFDGVLSKEPSSSKLSLKLANRSSTFWALNTGVTNSLFIYECSRDSPNSPVKENFKIFSRQKELSKTVLENIKNVLSQITSSASLVAIPRSNCFCDRLKGYEPRILPPPTSVYIPGQPIVPTLKQQASSIQSYSSLWTESLPVRNKTKLSQGNELHGCPPIEYVTFQFQDWERITGVWYCQWHSQDNHTDLSIEFGIIDPRTYYKRWQIIREKKEVYTGLLEMDKSSGEILSKQCAWQTHNVFYLYPMSTDYESYLIIYMCFPANKTFTISAWTRDKDFDLTKNEELADLAGRLMLKNGLEGDLFPVEHPDLDTKIESTKDELKCKNLDDKALLDVDVVRLRGNWRTILLNVEDVRCIGIKENKTALTNANNNRNEFWFDVFTEKGNQGLGRLKLYDDRRLTQFNSDVPGERNFTILDTDYTTYFVYYECNIIEINGILNKSVEFGLMARTPTLSDDIISEAVEIFNENGLGATHMVHQKDCHFQKEQIILKENYCKNVTNIKESRITDLDQISGKWWAHYIPVPFLNDIWMVFERNPNFTSDYTHVLKIVMDDSVLTLSVRQCPITGNVLMKDEKDRSAEEAQFLIMTDDYTSHLYYYKCHDLPGVYYLIATYGVFSRNCELSDSVRNKGKAIAQHLGLSDKLYHVKQYHCVLDYKYETRILSEKCIQFHDSEIIDVDLSKVVGQWDRHLISERLPHRYDYAIVTHRRNSIDYTVFPHQYHSRKTKVNGTSLMKTMSVTSKYVVLGNEAFIGFDQKSYVLKYSCAQYEQNGVFVVKELLLLSLRPQMSTRLIYDPNLFANILNTIPEKSLSKIRHLVAKLGHQLNPMYRHFGQTVIGSVDQRLNKWRLENRLSSQPDKEVYKFLAQSCDHFDEDEQILFNISTVVSTNWTLDYTNSVDILPYDRLLIRKQTETSFQLSLYNRDKAIALSDSYYDKEDGFFWSYTEGRRARKNYLFSNSDYRIVYICSERFINGILGTDEILFFYSAENTRRPRDWFSYLETLVTHLKPKTLGKVSYLLENMKPVFNGCNNQSPPSPFKLSLQNFLTPKLHFEQQIRGKYVRSAKTEDELTSTLNKMCEIFDSNEIVETDMNKMTGEWLIDWSNWVEPSREKGLYSIDITSNSGYFSSNLYFSNPDNTGRKIVSKYFYKRMMHKRAATSYYLKSGEQPSSSRSQFSILWTDYNNYFIGHQCFENEVNGEMSISEVITFYSKRSSTKRRDLSQYIDIIANYLSQKTISKLYHSLNGLVPINANIVENDLKSIHDNLYSNYSIPKSVVKDDISFAETIYLNFMPKGLIVEKINKQIVGKGFSVNSDAEVYKTLSSVCRQFDDNELIQVSTNRAAVILGSWQYSYYTRTRFVGQASSYEIDLKGSDSFEMKHYSGNDLVKTQETIFLPNSKWMRSSLQNGRHGISAMLYLDEEISVQYWCHENEIDDILTDTEGLIFSSRGPTTPPLEVFLNRLSASVKPSGLSKIVDLVSNLRPMDYDIRDRDCQTKRPKVHRFSEMNVVNQMLQKNCLYFNQRDLVEPDFRLLLGFWKVRLANVLDFHKPYDTIQWIDGTDRFYSKLRLGDIFTCKSKLEQLDDTNFFEEEFDHKRAIQAILYTDYTDAMIVYSCKENINDNKLAVMENLKFLVKNDSRKQSMELQDFQRLVLTKLKPNIHSKIQKFIPTLKYFYNESNSVLPVSGPVNRVGLANNRPTYSVPHKPVIKLRPGSTHLNVPSQINNRVQRISALNQHSIPSYIQTHENSNHLTFANNEPVQIKSSQPQHLLQGRLSPQTLTNNRVQDETGPVLVQAKQHNRQFNQEEDPINNLRQLSSSQTHHTNEVKGFAKSPAPNLPAPNLQNESPPEDDCPNLDSIAQHNIDFRRLSGRWDAIYTSNSRWDKDCIFTDDIYDSNTDSITQMKSTSGKRHKVFIQHSHRNGRQHILVDNIVFQSWILATDYTSYRLAYTCYVKEVNGKKKRIELERLYTRNIDAKDFDQNVLEALRRKSALIGKTLEPINRSQCQNGPVVRA